MTKRNPFLYIDDILESIHLINEYTRDISKEGFLNDAKLQDAVFRRMEIIGEAAKNLPEEFQEKYPHIPWRQIASTRDVISHEYFQLELDRIWKIIEERLPELKKNILAILEKEETS